MLESLEGPASLIFFLDIRLLFSQLDVHHRKTCVTIVAETQFPPCTIIRQVRHIPASTFRHRAPRSAAPLQVRLTHAAGSSHLCITHHTIVRYPTVMYSSSTAESGSQDQGIARKQHEPVLDLQLRCDTNMAPYQCDRRVAPQHKSG